LQRFLARLIDRDEGVSSLVRIPIQQVSPDAGLDADHRDPMGQDVVELARDADALFTRAPVGLVFAAPLRFEGSLLDLLEIRSPAPRGLAEDEAGNEPASEPQGRNQV